MRYRHAIFALVIVAATLSQTGCKGFSPSGGSGSAVTEGVGSGSLYIYTHLSSGIWQNAAVSGSANPATTLCFGTNDIKCSTSFPPVTDGSLGELIFSTDAIPGYWTVAAEADSNCSSGGSNSGSVANPGRLDINCGGSDGTDTAVSPSSFTVIYVNGVLQASPPPYLAATTTSSILPTSYALTTGWYSDEAASEGSSQNTASSTTQIRVPGPTSFGLNVITIVDPTTNQVLGAADYVLHECFITAGQYGNSENCPY
jgi:hypothetical protein